MMFGVVKDDQKIQSVARSNHVVKVANLDSKVVLAVDRTLKVDRSS